MPKCWCGRNHETISQRGDVRNSSMTHGVFNWKLYELRMVDQGGDPFGENGKEMVEEKKQKD